MASTVTVNVHGLTLRVKAGFYDRFWRSVEDGTWEKETFSAFDHLVEPDSIVLDIGASVGALTLYAAGVARKVYSFEPDPVNYNELVSNVSLNPSLADSIVCSPQALAPKSRRTHLRASRFFGDSSASLMPRSGEVGETVLVDCLRYADLLQSYSIDPRELSLVKIDIEGGEFWLIPDMASLLRAQPVSLHLSLHGPYLARYYLRKLLRHQYLCRLVVKAEALTSVPFFTALFVRPLVRRRIRKLFAAVDHYHYCYDGGGAQPDRHEMLKSACDKATTIILTNQPWGSSTRQAG